jgi:DNA-binding XRE family transcriptional regulator
MISRAQLALRCKQLAEEAPAKYVTVSMSTIRDLEAGERKPRPNTANTLAVALRWDAQELFPSGFDDKPRNPSGKTRVPEDRSRVGRPSNQK